MNMTRCFAMVLLSVFVVGCESSERIEPPKIKPQDRNVGQSIQDTVLAQQQSLQDIQKAVESNNTALESTKTHIEEINRNADMIVVKTDDPDIKANADGILQHAEELDSRLDLVKENTQTIANETASIKEGGTRLKEDSGAVVNLQKRNTELEGEKEKLQNGAIKDLYTTLSFFFGLGFLTVIAGLVLAFMVNRKLGYSIAILGLLGLAMAAGAIFYLKTIATVAVALIVGAIVVSVALGVWYFIKEVREKDDYIVATEENVQLIQNLKSELPDELRQKFFGEKKQTSVAEEMQSDATKEIVQKVKSQLTEGETE